jgi:two-component system response regulator FixJ
MLIHIVDDDPKIRGATSFLLARQGYKTQIYASTDELLGQERLRDGCVLLKWGIAGLATRELVNALVAKGWSVPVIMIGENTPAIAAVDALRSGALDFLQRTYDEAELIAAVERALDRSREFSVHRQRRNSASALLARLSPRKRQVLQGLLAGMSN